MSKVLYFDEYLKENNSMDINIKDSDDKSNIFDIQIEGELNIKKFKVNNDSVIDMSTNKEVDDESLKKYVLKSVKSINKIKDTTKADDLQRVSGGIEKMEDKLEKDMSNESDPIRIIRGDDYPKLKKVIKELQVGEGKFIKFEPKIQNGSTTGSWWCPEGKPKSVGKGEFLLPILYYDVHKNSLDTKGDNTLNSDDGNEVITQLELKAAGATFEFMKGIELSTDKIKEICVKSLLKYCLRRDLGNLCLIVFNNDIQHKENPPTGFWILNCGQTYSPNSKDVINGIEKIYNEVIKNNIEIRIKEGKNTSHDFCISYEGKDDNGKLVFHLNQKYKQYLKENFEVKKFWDFI